MTLTQARALCSHIEYADHDPQRDRKSLEALGRWMMRFSPMVACGMDPLPVSAKARKLTEEQTPDCLFLDLTGNERLFGSFENLVNQVCDALDRLGISASVAVAPTPGAAWALAFAGRHRRVVPPEMLEKELSLIPVSALRLDEEIVSALTHLGLCTIGQVMHLPREVLPARFGSILLRRVDQALGMIPEPLVPLEYQEKVEARMDWDGAVQSLDAIWMVFQKLIARVIAQLVQRGRGARQLRFELLRAHAPPVERIILLSRPSRDPVNLFNLFRCALEDLELPVRQKPKSRLRARRLGTPPRETQVFDEGFCGMRITVPLCEKLSDEQITLLGHEQYAGQAELDRLIERLRVRLGNDAVLQAELVEAYVPEESWGQMSCQFPVANCQKKSGNDAPCPLATNNWQLTTARPLHLFPHPVEVRVMVTPSEDLEGNPAAFTYEGITRTVIHQVGPERIGGRWWDGHDKTRDYFDVSDAAGQRFWIFRVAQTGKWYLHGTFE